VRFFTARLDPSCGRAGQRSRQDVYLEALSTLPRLTIHFGELVEHAKRQWLVHTPAGGPRTAEVWVPEEKGRTSIWRPISSSMPSAAPSMWPS